MRKPTSPPIGIIFIVVSFLTGCASSVPEQHVVQSAHTVTNQGADEKVQRLRDSSIGASRLSRECIRYHEILHNLLSAYSAKTPFLRGVKTSVLILLRG